MKISKFIKKHPILTGCTLGFSVIGYLGYRAVLWIKHKICKTNKVNHVSSSSLSESSISTPLSVKAKKTFKAKLISDSGRVSETKRLKKLYDARVAKKPPESKIQSPYNAPAGFVNWVPGNFGIWMPGVAFIASRLLEKKDLEGLYVCDTLEAFTSRLKKIAAQDQYERCAFIIPTFCSGQPSSFPNFPQHKASVFVEKKAGQLTIALLDAEGSNESPILQEHLTEDLWEGFEAKDEFNAQELAFRAILKACHCVDDCNPRLFRSAVKREYRYGCAVFALQDAVTYLQNPDFFDEIICSEDAIDLGDDEVIEIIELPADYMIGVQSSQFFTKLKAEKRKSFFQQPLAGRKKNLQQYMDAYFVNQANKNPQNHYITKKVYQYLDMIIAGMKELNTSQFNKSINKTLITEIDTDLFPCND